MHSIQSVLGVYTLFDVLVQASTSASPHAHRLREKREKKSVPWECIAYRIDNILCNNFCVCCGSPFREYLMIRCASKGWQSLSVRMFQRRAHYYHYIIICAWICDVRPDSSHSLSRFRGACNFRKQRCQCITSNWLSFAIIKMEEISCLLVESWCTVHTLNFVQTEIRQHNEMRHYYYLFILK